MMDLRELVRGLLLDLNDRSDHYLKADWYKHDDQLDRLNHSTWKELHAVLEKCTPDESGTEFYQRIRESIEVTVDEIIQRGERKETRKAEAEPQPKRIIRLALEQGIEPFLDERGQCYATYNVGQHREIHPIDSEDCMDWLGLLLWESEEVAVAKETVDTAARILRAMAKTEGRKYQLHNRAAFVDGALWYDLSDCGWRAVKITENGWEIVDRPPILFRRYPHMQSQATPEKNGNLEEFFALHNLPKGKDDGMGKNEKLLYKIDQLIPFIPDIPRCMEALYGKPGSVKSGNQKLTKRLVDPSIIGEMSLPNDPNTLIQTLEQHYLVVFGNVTRLEEEQSNILSRAVTGEGHQTRELYTNDGAFIRSFKRAIKLNGINVPSGLPDWKERVVTQELEPTTEDERKLEAAVLEEFDRIRGKCLGAAFDIVSKALAKKKNVHLDKLPRMADYAVWGEAIARAMDYPDETFVKAYDANRAAQNVQTLQDEPVGLALEKLLDDNADFVGTATDLLSGLTLKAEDLGIDTKKLRKWPKGPQALSRQFNEIRLNLENTGYDVDHLEHETALKDERLSDFGERLKLLRCSRKTKVYIIRSKATEPDPSVPPIDSPAWSAPKNNTAPHTAPTSQTDESGEVGAMERYSPSLTGEGEEGCGGAREENTATPLQGSENSASGHLERYTKGNIAPNDSVTIQGRLKAIADDYAKGVRPPQLEEKHGAAWVQHARDRGIIPVLGGQP
jgi:hypothetical protein